MRRVRSVIFVIVAVAAVGLCLLLYHDSVTVSEGEAVFRFIDVGEGDCTLITTSDATVVIDTGTGENSEALAAELSMCGVRVIDCLILTHPHEDHIGGAVKLLENFSVKQVLMTSFTYESATYDKLNVKLDTLAIPVEYVKSGAEYKFGALSMRVLAPNSDYYNDLNESSMVIRAVFGEVSVMLTGDAGELAENEILDAYAAYGALRCDILKVGHHGSSGSSSKRFLDAVSPDYAVISCEAENEYGHPHMSALYRLDEVNAYIFVTSETGTVTFTTDGREIEFKTERSSVNKRGYSPDDQ